MSEFLFQHSRIRPGLLKLRLAVLGAVGGLLFGLFAGVLGLQAVGVLGSGTRVTVILPTIGDTLGINSDVKYRGLRVGRVIEVDPGGGSGEPRAKVIVEDEQARLIPAGVKARVLPGTLFGNEFIDLVSGTGSGGLASPTAAAAAEHLSDGQVVEADTSKGTVRLMATLEATQRLLASADPSQWDAALSQIAETLDGRGDDLAAFITDANRFLGRWEGQQPQVILDLRLLADNAETFADVEPLVVAALRNTRPLARTLVEHEERLADLMRSGERMLADEEYGATAFVSDQGPRTSQLLHALSPTLAAFAERSPAFRELLSKVPALLVNGAAAVVDGRIQMEGVLAPESQDPYDRGDCPRYRGLPGPNCGGGVR